MNGNLGVLFNVDGGQICWVTTAGTEIMSLLEWPVILCQGLSNQFGLVVLKNRSEDCFLSPLPSHGGFFFSSSLPQWPFSFSLVLSLWKFQKSRSGNKISV